MVAIGKQLQKEERIVKAGPMKRFLSGMMASLCLLTACSVETQEQDTASADNSAVSSNAPADKPTVPAETPEDLREMYNFSFSERYDDKIAEAFSLMFSQDVQPNPMVLLQKYENQMEAVGERIYNSDGMEPHKYREYEYAVEAGGRLVVRTDYYEPDQAEYVSCLWTDLEGTRTNLGVGVGSSETDLLAAYQEDLYYLEGDHTEQVWSDELSAVQYQYAYAWQPFTEENNDIRDITFYIRDGVVAAIEMTEPYELRYVYGYDRAAGLQAANKRREELGRTGQTDQA